MVLVAGCSGQSSNDAVVTEYVTVTSSDATRSPSVRAGSARSSAPSGCKAPVIAIDPGHNPVETAEFDPETGVAMRDYSNGAEDGDAMAVSQRVESDLADAGYTVVLLKKSADESVTYRERVTRAEKAGADIGVSIHTYTDDHRVFVQRVGLYREGVGADGQPLRVEFTNEKTAAKSQKYGRAIAEARTKVEKVKVAVTDNSFAGRAPLWTGDIPMIALIAEDIPWVYNEFGIPGGGGSAPIGADGVETYANGVTAGIKSALPNLCK